MEPHPHIKGYVTRLWHEHDPDWDWITHIRLVEKYATLLAKEMDADVEICRIAAWLHDIAKIQRKGDSLRHHVEGAEQAAQFLGKLGYPRARITQIQHCILTHSSDQDYIPESDEAKIIASADAMSHFDNFCGLASTAYGMRHYSLEEGRKWLLKKYRKCWKKMQILPASQTIMKTKYDAIQKVLKPISFKPE
ncbi:MAG: HD domain-containing protein [Nanoarchaeota archaeon]